MQKDPKMPKNKMLIDAAQLGEIRVAMVRGNNVDEFDFESENKKRLRGNIYLAKVTRVEPSLQAAFIEYGGNRHGFLTFNEIHPDYYQIPVADRQALIEAEAEEARREQEKDEPEDDENDKTNEDSEDEEIVNGDEDNEDGHNNNDEDNDSKNEDDEDEKDEEDGSRTINADNESDDVITEEITSRVRRQTSRPRKKQADAKNESNEDTSAEDTSDRDTSAGDEDDDSEKKTKSTKPQKNRKKEAEKKTKNKSQDDADEVNDKSDDDSDSGDNDEGETKSVRARGRRKKSSVKRNVRARKTKNRDDEIDEEEDEIDSIGGEDELEEIQPKRRTRKEYKIQEVIKKRQILLVQVSKEERGNKGAALTTYLSLAGRYSVLMPNTARGGGISKKISQGNDRKRLKKIAQELDVPKGMGVIVRTAGASQTKDDIQRDFEYLFRLWEKIRTLTLESNAPTLVYEEGSLIKRSIRDLFDKNTSEIIVAGKDGYEEAKEFINTLMPENTKCVKQYKDKIPMFAKLGVEEQLSQMLEQQVILKSGGYLVINQTEALVAIDVNSGRATRQHSIEETANLTNLEAAEEIPRQLRLRDLSGLIVIDFIDMDERKNNRAVERKLKEALRNDRARIQVGRISHFGLLEMSRQRLRTSMHEAISQTCPQCNGTGNVKADSFVAMSAIRCVEENLNKNPNHNINLKITPNAAMYILNKKRKQIDEIENKYNVSVNITVENEIKNQQFIVEKAEVNKNKNQKNSVQPDTIAVSDEKINGKNNKKNVDKGVKQDEIYDEIQENNQDKQKGWWKKTFF